MGWMWKVIAFLVAVALYGLGAWELSVVILAALFLPPMLRMKGGAEGKARPRRFVARYALAGLLFVLAFAGYVERGAYSPYVFAFLGVVALVWGRLPVPSLRGGSLRPVDDSILLRSSPLPVSWAAVAEVKPLTRDLGRALGGVTGTVVISGREDPAVYTVVESTGWSERSAEEAVLEALRETAKSLSPLGAYLLPLDSRQAAAVLQPSLEACRKVEGGWSSALALGGYDVVSIRQEGGFAESLGLYKKVGAGREGRARLPPPTVRLSHPPLLLEVFKALGGRLASPHPDQYTAFLSSLLATSGEPIGTRVVEAGAGSQAQVVVKSQGSPAVELSRAQLRAVVRVYDKGAQRRP